MKKDDEYFMRLAIDEAKKALLEGNRPFGAIIVKNGQVIAAAHAQVGTNHDPTAHGEISAIRTTCKKLRTHNLGDSTLYTTCEPCMMCSSAIFWAKIPRVVVGALAEDNPRYLDYIGLSKLSSEPRYKIEKVLGVLRDECKKLYENL